MFSSPDVPGVRLALMLAWMALPSLLYAEQVHYRIERGVMGTSLEIDLYGEDLEVLKDAADAAVAEMERIEVMMTTWKPSPLTELNDAAGKGPQAVPPELAQIIARAKMLHDATDGAFDISFYAVGRLWDFKAEFPAPPSPEAIQAALVHVDASRIQVNAERCEVELPAGMSIDLGGIAKGYGVDRAMKVLMDHGIKNAMVNAGGDLKALGLNEDTPWEIAIKHPRNAKKALATVRLSNQCLVTSGDYERFFKLDGRIYHHIFDPRTGMSATGCISVSVIGPNAELADALATACCVLGPERGKKLIESFPRMSAIFVGMDGSVTMTENMPVQSASRSE